MKDLTTLTGIPIEWLFSIIGVLIGSIYLDLKREVRGLRRESNKRGESIAKIRLAVNAICKHIRLPIDLGNGEKDD